MIILDHLYHVYILTNQWRTVVYVGVTNDLGTRIYEHYKARGNPKTFCGRYNCHFLIYYEGYDYIQEGIQREKELKKWSRQKKMDLIRTMNPLLENLYPKIFDCWPPKP